MGWGREPSCSIAPLAVSQGRGTLSASPPARLSPEAKRLCLPHPPRKEELRVSPNAGCGSGAGGQLPPPGWMVLMGLLACWQGASILVVSAEISLDPPLSLTGFFTFRIFLEDFWRIAVLVKHQILI